MTTIRTSKPWLVLTLHMATVLALATLLGLTFNALRPEPLPLCTISTRDSAYVSLDQARQIHAEGQAAFIDARDTLTYAAGHIRGALSLPAEDFTFVFPALQTQLQDRPLVVYCDGEHCTLSQDVITRLRAAGLTDIRELRNGWTRWREAGYPTGPNPSSNAGSGVTP